MARMMLSVAVICLLVVGAAAGQTSRQSQLEQAWGQELTPESTSKAYVSPVKRVVNLLTKMKSELEAEAEKEAEMYDKMVCWCETNDKEKTQSIANLEAADIKLQSEIEGRAARGGVLGAEIANTKVEIQDNTQMLQQAQQIREGEAAKFREEEVDMVQAVTNLRNAIAVLSKHQTTQALLQIDGTILSGMRVLLRDASIKYEELVAGRAERRGLPAPSTALVALKAETQRAVGRGKDDVAALLLSALNIHDGPVTDTLPVRFAAELIQKAAQPAADGKTFLQVHEHQPLYESRSAARSSGIYGVMNQMLEEFESELTQSQKDELNAQQSHSALATAKTNQIEAGKANLDNMEEESSANNKGLSDAKEDLDITRNQRSEDVEFKRNLMVTCNDLDTQWEKRSKTRAAETKAVAEAIAILTEDDNREMLAKSVKLLQERSETFSSAEAVAMRLSAVAALRKAAQAPEFEADDLLAAWHGRHGAGEMLGAAAGPRAQLSTLAVAVQLDSFTKVKQMMDTMLAELKEQQANEVKFKDYCQTEFRTTEKTVHDKNRLKKDLETQIDQLEALIKSLSEEIAEAKKQIAENQLSIKKAGQTREEENAEFQTVVADQRATQSILQKALMKLKDFYHKGINSVVLAQQSGAQTPPVQFNDYKNNAGSNPAIGLIEQILEDSRALEGEATAGESRAQADYQAFVKDSNNLIASLQASVASKNKAIATAEEDKAEASSDWENTVGELESLAAYEADLHAECDFVIKNFDIRQKARTQEMEAIQSAKAILSGKK